MVQLEALLLGRRPSRLYYTGSLLTSHSRPGNACIKLRLMCLDLSLCILKEPRGRTSYKACHLAPFWQQTSLLLIPYCG